MGHEDEFWDILEDAEVCMVTTEGGGRLHSRPMAPHVDRERKLVRFLTGGSAPKVGEILHESEVNLAFSDPGSMNFASVSGRAEISRDRELIRELWNGFADAWFEGDAETADVAVVTVRPDQGQYWNGTGSRIAQMWELAKAKATGGKPDMGDNAKVEIGR